MNYEKEISVKNFPPEKQEKGEIRTPLMGYPHAAEHINPGKPPKTGERRPSGEPN